jgi:hypothetical protein
MISHRHHLNDLFHGLDDHDVAQVSEALTTLNTLALRELFRRDRDAFEKVFADLQRALQILRNSAGPVRTSSPERIN